MKTQSFDKNNDVKSKNSHKETLKAQDLDTEREFLVLPTEKGRFESEESYKNSHDLKGEKESFYKKQERLNAASNAPNDRVIEEAILLSVKEPISRAIFDRNSAEETEICGEDQDSYLNLSISNLHEQNQQESLKANSSCLRSYLFALNFQTNCFNSLQDLDFTRCLLGKHAIHTFCYNYELKSLKSLILTQNPIRNDSINFISETSNWQKLQTLICCNTQIDYDGVKWFAVNESWINLKELDLSENSLIGDLRATSLCLNQRCASLKTLSLLGCNLGTFRAIASRRRRNYTVLFAKDKTTIEAENQNFSFKKVSFRTTHDNQNPRKNLPNYHFTCSNRHLQSFKSTLRGGSPKGDCDNDTSDINNLGLLAKFQQYKEKILNDTSLEKELKLFIEVQASTIPANHHGTNNENSSDVSQHLKLSFELKRHLLYHESSEASKILLLTGQAGIGKSLFCKHLQRELLSDWSQNPDSEDRNWFPIYIELSSLKNPKSEAISETLSRELSLTNEQILFLEASELSNLCLPRLLFIFDGYDAIQDIQAFHSLISSQQLTDNNFFVLNKIDGASWKNAKFVVTCREENLQKVQRRDLLFTPINTESSELLVASGSLLQRKIEPFSDEQITCYLKKYYCYESNDTTEKVSSWNQVQVFDKILDNYQVREMARIPFILSIMYQIFPSLITNESEQIIGVKSLFSHCPSRRFLIEFFLDGVIRSMTRESLDASNSLESNEEHKYVHKGEDYQQQVDLQKKEIRHQAQNFALKLSGYSINQIATEYDINGGTLISKLHPHVTWENSNSRVRFNYPLLLEFLVAKSIEEEIKELVPLKLDESLKIKKELLISQRLLTSRASDAIVFFFLIDAIKDERLTANQFLNLIYLSRQRELDQKQDGGKIPNASDSNSQTPFTIAAFNAITILNTAGHDFSHQDLSSINIASANLSFGMFEGTNFAGSNLKGVDFTGSRLKSANFVKANLEGIEFGAIRRLKLRNEKTKKIAFSPDGEYLAVDVGFETVIFDVVDIQRSHFKEIKRFPGYFLG